VEISASEVLVHITRDIGPDTSQIQSCNLKSQTFLTFGHIC